MDRVEPALGDLEHSLNFLSRIKLSKEVEVVADFLSPQRREMRVLLEHLYGNVNVTPTEAEMSMLTTPFLVGWGEAGRARFVRLYTNYEQSVHALQASIKLIFDAARKADVFVKTGSGPRQLTHAIERKTARAVVNVYKAEANGLLDKIRLINAKRNILMDFSLNVVDMPTFWAPSHANLHGSVRRIAEFPHESNNEWCTIKATYYVSGDVNVHINSICSCCCATCKRRNPTARTRSAADSSSTAAENTTADRDGTTTENGSAQGHEPTTENASANRNAENAAAIRNGATANSPTSAKGKDGSKGKRSKRNRRERVNGSRRSRINGNINDRNDKNDKNNNDDQSSNDDKIDDGNRQNYDDVLREARESREFVDHIWTFLTGSSLNESIERREASSSSSSSSSTHPPEDSRANGDPRPDEDSRPSEDSRPNRDSRPAESPSPNGDLHPAEQTGPSRKSRPLRRCSCQSCDLTETTPKQFLACMRCIKMKSEPMKFYCGVDCQVVDWEQSHKQFHVEESKMRRERKKELLERAAERMLEVE